MKTWTWSRDHGTKNWNRDWLTWNKDGKNWNRDQLTWNRDWKNWNRGCKCWKTNLWRTADSSNCQQ